MYTHLIVHIPIFTSPPKAEYNKQLFLEQQFMHGALYDGKKPFLSPLYEGFLIVERTLPIIVTDPDIHSSI